MLGLISAAPADPVRTPLLFSARRRYRAAWADPARKARTLERFSQTGANGGADIAAAARRATHPELNRDLNHDDPERSRTSSSSSCGSSRGGRIPDIAASVQHVTEEALLHLARHALERVPSPNLCAGGELALNARAMSRLHRDGPFESLHLEAQAHDAGAAEGELERHVAEALAAGQLVGRVHGRAAWSPHGLGRRSVLADPRHASARDEIDRRAARREASLPLHAAATRARAASLLDLPAGADEALRCGQLAVPVREAARERIPAVVHRDGTVRVHLVDEASDPELHRLLTQFQRIAGIALLAETDLAARGEPPVRGAFEAVQLFERCELDALVLGERLLERARAPAGGGPSGR